MIKIITQESLTPWKHNRKKQGVAQDFCTVFFYHNTHFMSNASQKPKII